MDEVFYRKVIDIADNPVTKLLTLFTVDVPLAEIIEHGSLTLSSESVVFPVDTDGVVLEPTIISPMAVFDKEISLGTFGMDASGF